MPKCEKCDKEFKSDQALKIHVGRMHGEKKAKAASKMAKPVAKAAKGAFACEACGRTFKLPAHLARHASVAHPKAGKAKTAPKVGRPAGRRAVAGSAPVGLAQIPVSILQAELQRRAKKAGKKLRKLLRQRAKLDAQIAELEAIIGVAPTPVAEAAPKVKRGRKPGRKPVAKPTVRRQRKTFGETAEQFILRLTKGKGATTSQINDAWQAMGRGGTADNALSRLVQAGKLKREKLTTGKGSTYRRV